MTRAGGGWSNLGTEKAYTGQIRPSIYLTVTGKLCGRETERMTSRKSGVKDEKMRLKKLHLVFECEGNKRTMMELCPKFDIAHEASYAWLRELYDPMFPANAETAPSRIA